MKNRPIFRIIRIFFFFMFTVYAIAMINRTRSFEDPILIVYSAFLVAGIVGLFLETYKKNEE